MSRSSADANVSSSASPQRELLSPIDDKSFFRSVLSFVFDLISPQNRKATIILCYAVFALTLWKYLPPAPRFADPETGKCVLNDQTFENNNFGAVFGNSNDVSAQKNSTENSTESLNSPSIKPLDGTLSAETTPLR
ncbi:MAG: hypothetical protein IJZ10_02915, partial [Thermoguttaceae bacterium]|nr:hypothetical protein [Thermoguttaceae bacterium]